ncbi:unnamed protein product [Rotaria sordida]|uniref:EF-hand domain-containing protein n=1 Tax=Rotaria sordida TaxID=392033 RepID=A0A815EDG6_9BILA|nr:unnamed protein product [Rotaria sordida]
MSGYEYSSYSSSTGATPGIATAAAPSPGAFDASKAIFNQVDRNQDGAIDRHEFQQWVSGGAGAGAAGGGGGIGGATAAFDTGSYELSNISSGGIPTGGAFGVDSGLTGSSFESSTLTSGGISGISGIAGIGGIGGIEGGFSDISGSTFDSTTANAGYDATSIHQAANYTPETNAAWSRYGAEVRGAGLYVDANPQIIRRQVAGGVQTYTQNIRIRFLQPPPLPPPGPIIIKEVRPPQPPVPPPLRVRQQAPPLPQPAPLILRERPPPPPPSQASQTVVRQLPALPVPPRSVIIERIPAAPPRPRDIIIERWIPYGAAAKRKTIVQRAEAAKEYSRPRNVIIQYEPVQVRVIRQFHRLGIVQENPQAYLQRYGAQLLDTQTLIQQARAAGVVEDISPPAGASVATISSSSLSGGAAFSGADVLGVAGGELGGGGGGGGGGSSSFSTGNYQSSQIGGAEGLIGGGFDSGLVEGIGVGGTYGSSNFESSSYLSGTGGGAIGGYGVDLGISGGLPTGYSSSSYESLGGAGAGGAGGVGSFDAAAAAFSSIDTNKDGSLDANEFKQFYQAGL